MSFIDDSGGVPAKSVAWRWRVLLLALALLMCLAGPAMIVFTFLFADGAESWISLVIDIAALVVMLPFGIWLWVWQAHEHKQSLRLREVGIPSSAEVLAVSSVSYGEESRMSLTLRFAGPGLTPFQAAFTCAYDASVSVGDRLGAVVDPSTNTYAISQLR